MAEPSRWCLVTSLPNWERFAAVGRWALDRPTRMKNVKRGDRAVVYLTRNPGVSSFAGVVEFLEDHTTIEQAPEGVSRLYRHAVPIEVVSRVVGPLPLEAVKADLQFIPKRKNWSIVLQGRPILPIPTGDFDLVASRLAQLAERQKSLTL